MLAGRCWPLHSSTQARCGRYCITIRTSGREYGSQYLAVSGKVMLMSNPLYSCFDGGRPRELRPLLQDLLDNVVNPLKKIVALSALLLLPPLTKAPRVFV